MGASTTTPIYELSQFSDTDKPTWRGDYNGDMNKIEEALLGKADKTTLDFYMADYGVTGNGSDETALAQSCIDAAAVNGGVVRTVRGKTIGLSSELFVKNGVILEGDTANYNGVTGAVNTPTFKFLSNNARLRVGAWQGNAGSVHGDQAGGVQNVLIDCNNFGPSNSNHDGAVYVECTGFLLQDVEVINNPNGPGFYFEAAQNGEVIGCDVRGSLVGICLDNGAGGLLFSRCEISNNQTGILTTDDPAKGNAYPFGPAHITFEHCIVENYVPAVVAVDHQCGNLNFVNCDFSNDIATALTRGTLVDISDPFFSGIASVATFDSCIFAGGTVAGGGDTAIRLTGSNEFYVYGDTYMQHHTAPFVQNGGAGIGSFEGFLVTGNNVGSPMFSAINSGTVINWFNKKYQTAEYIIDPSITQAAIYFKMLGDAGVRGYLASNGSINWCSGADFNQIGAIGLDSGLTKNFYYNPGGGHVFQGTTQFNAAVSALSTLSVGSTLTVTGAATIGGLTTLLGGLTESTVNTFPAGAVTINAAAVRHQVFVMTGATSVTGLTINNAVAGTRLRITYNTVATAYNFLWPTGATAGAGKTFPADNGGAAGVWSIDFYYTGSQWVELGRNF